MLPPPRVGRCAFGVFCAVLTLPTTLRGQDTSEETMERELSLVRVQTAVAHHRAGAPAAAMPLYQQVLRTRWVHALALATCRCLARCSALL
jgi:hypothetical protein